MTEKIEPIQDERDWLAAHRFSCWVKDGRAWSYGGSDGQCHFTPHFTSFYNAVSTTQQKIQHEHGED